MKFGSSKKARVFGGQGLGGRLKAGALAPILALTMMLQPQAVWAQSACSDIDNDIERLACFDAEFPRQASTSSDPLDIFNDLRALASSTPDLSGARDDIVRFDRDYLDIVTYGDGCQIGVLQIVPSMGRRGSDDFGVTRLLGYDYTYQEVDLTLVASVLPFNSQGEVSVSMRRGHEIPRYRFNTQPDPQFDPDISAQLMLFNSQGALYPEVQRTQTLRIAAEPEDDQEAYALFSRLVDACQ